MTSTQSSKSTTNSPAEASALVAPVLPLLADRPNEEPIFDFCDGCEELVEVQVCQDQSELGRGFALLLLCEMCR